MERSCAAAGPSVIAGSTAALSKVWGTAASCPKPVRRLASCHCKHWDFGRTAARLQKSVRVRWRERSWHGDNCLPIKRKELHKRSLVGRTCAGKGERIDIYEGAPRPEPQPKPSLSNSDTPAGDYVSESPGTRRHFQDGPVPPTERRRRKRKQPKRFNMFFLVLKACTIAALAHTVAMNLADETSTWEVSVVVALAVYLVTKLTREIPPLKEAGIRLFRQREEQAASGLLTLVAGGVCTVLWGALSNGYNIGLATLLLQFAAVGYMFGTYGRIVRAGV